MAKQKRIELTLEQKSNVVKLFCKSPRMKQLVEDYIKSFRVLDGFNDGKGKDPQFYSMWSSVGGKVFNIPASELIEGQEKSPQN